MIAKAAGVLVMGAAFALVSLTGAGRPPGPGMTLAASSAPAPAGSLGVAGIGAVASAAGFAGPSLAMAIAVALAESSGDPTATDQDSNGTVDRGLWQINSVHRAYSPACDYDPACAARAAYAISQSGTDWSPWVTYDHGAEIAYLPPAIAWVAARSATP